jgi:aldose 1-epimerase
MGMTAIAQDLFGTVPSGEAVPRFTLSTDAIEVEILAYGGIIRALRVCDSRGARRDAVLGFDSFEPYLRNPAYFGAIIGRYANRIANAEFQLNGRTYTLARNDGPNSLHGGIRGFDKRLWHAEQQDALLHLTYISQDGEEGYPGNLAIQVTYGLHDSSLHIHYSATTDQPTILNLTNHSYFNLAGVGSIIDHGLEIAAEYFTPVDATQIPTGEFRNVSGTPFDFRQPRRIGDRISEPDEQLVIGKGYDHNWVLRHPPRQFSRAALLVGPDSRCAMEVHTDQPGIQLYTGNLLDGSIVGKRGHIYECRAGLCLETQHFPDSPHHPEFPSAALGPGERFSSRTAFVFHPA